MAGSHLTCETPGTEKGRAVREAGERLAQLMAALDRGEGPWQSTVNQMFAATRSLSPTEKQCALDYAELMRAVAR